VSTLLPANTAVGADMDATRIGELPRIQVQHEQLSATLRTLADVARGLDAGTASRQGHAPAHPPRVGTCPDCGYPSLDSGLCAFCRPGLTL
jgi:hypothetical protein